MSYHFRNLVFEGGGVKGVAYVGAMQVLQERDILPQIKNIGGASAGAINAVALGLNYSVKEVRSLMNELDFNNLLDDSPGVLRDTNRLIHEFGWYKGDYFRKWIGDVIYRKTGNSESTFEDIEVLKERKGFRSLHFIGSNISTHFSEIFSAKYTPRVCIADAVRISMSLPLIFAAKRSMRGDVYVDGGMLNNYPVKLFDRAEYLDGDHGRTTNYYNNVNDKMAGAERQLSSPYIYNKQTLGFRLDSKELITGFRDQAEAPAEKIEDFFDYTRALITTLMGVQESMHLHSDDWARTVYIDTLDVKTTDFGLDIDRKNALINSGREYTTKYLDWYDSATPEEAPNK